MGVVAAARKPKLVVDTTRAESLALDSSAIAPMYSYLEVILGVVPSFRWRLRSSAATDCVFRSLFG